MTMGPAASCGCDQPFDGLDQRYQRLLWAVILINGTMFVIEMWGGHAAGSRALEADALDFLGDSLTYGLSLWAIGRAATVRARAAIFKGISLLLMGLYVFAKTIFEVFYLGLPRAELMGGIGALAFIANVVSVLLLVRYKDGDANVRSVWLCSRNDAIGNLIVIAAAGSVWASASGWPDVIVAFVMAGLFTNSAWQILTQARREIAEDATQSAKGPSTSANEEQQRCDDSS